MFSNPLVIVILLLFVIIGIYYIVSESLNKSYMVTFEAIDENSEFLKAKVKAVYLVLEGLVNNYLNDLEMNKLLVNLKNNMNTNETELSELIKMNNLIFEFINKPILNEDKYQEIFQILNRNFMEGLNDNLIKERNRYNNYAGIYNMKIMQFPYSILGNEKLNLFQDLIIKKNDITNNSVSYLNNNYKIDQRTVTSQVVLEKDDSNLYLASKVKPEVKKEVDFNREDTK